MARVGIDFGTCNSSVMYKDKNGNVKSVLMDNNDRVITYARSEVYLNNNNVILSGWEISENNRRANNNERNITVKFLKTILADNSNNKTYFGYNKWKLAEKYIEYLIKKSDDLVYNDCGEHITEVVLSKPIKFNTSYHEPFKRCVESIVNHNVNIKVPIILDEPIAIALNHMKPNETIAVADLGGGTFDASIVQEKNGVYKVLDSDGLEQAGNYLDELLCECAVGKERIKDYIGDNFKYKNFNRYILAIAKEDIEETKVVDFDLRSSNGMDECTVKVDDYKKNIKPFIDKLIKIMSDLITNSAIDIKRMVLAGGGANSKYIVKRFSKAFPNLEIISNDTDKRVATAAGNAKYVGGDNILNQSYGIRAERRTNGEKFVLNMFFKNEKLPTEWRCNKIYNPTDTKYLIMSLYTGDEMNSNNKVDFNYENTQVELEGFLKFEFNHLIKENTLFEFWYRLDESGIIEAKVIIDGEEVEASYQV